jgi:hypothetical protein
MSPVPRWLPDEPLPPYAFVPGRSPHPHSDPAGHSYGMKPEPVSAPDPQNWQECRPYLRGLDLFNHGYYWEAHEVWESLWQAAGRRGVLADFFKGLIKLAAAGVKVREHNRRGLLSHAGRASELFIAVAERMPTGGETRYMGLGLAELINQARRLAKAADLPSAVASDDALNQLPVLLQPH